MVKVATAVQLAIIDGISGSDEEPIGDLSDPRVGVEHPLYADMLSGKLAFQRARRDLKDAPPETLGTFVLLGLRRSFAMVNVTEVSKRASALELGEVLFTHPESAPNKPGGQEA